MSPCPSRRGGALRVLLILIAVLVLLGLAALYFLDSAAAKAVEKGGTYALGVPTRVESTSIGLVSGQFTLSGLQVDNPPGFDEPRFLALERAEMDAGLSKLLGDRVEIERVEIRGVTIDLERKNGATNYDPLLESLRKLSSGKESSGDSHDAKQFVIKKLVLTDVKARVGLLPALPAQTVALPSMELSNVGSDKHTATLAQVFERIVGELLTSAIANGGNLIPADVGNAMKQRLSALKGVSESQIDKLKDAGKAIEQGAKDLKDDIKGLFGK